MLIALRFFWILIKEKFSLIYHYIFLTKNYELLFVTIKIPLIFGLIVWAVGGIVWDREEEDIEN